MGEEIEPVEKFLSLDILILHLGRSLRMHYLSPGKPWTFMFFDSGMSWRTVLKCLYIC